MNTVDIAYLKKLPATCWYRDSDGVQAFIDPAGAQFIGSWAHYDAGKPTCRNRWCFIGGVKYMVKWLTK